MREMPLRNPLLSILASCLLAALPATVQAKDSSQDQRNGKHKHEKEQVCEICNAKKHVNELIPGVTWGADLRLRAIYDESLKLDKNARGHDRFWSRYRGRIWTRISPIDDLQFNIRIVTEPRIFCRPNLENQTIRQEVIFDKLNVRWTNVLGLPLTLKVGRQDIKMGDGWLVIEGTPRDGTRTFFFDAIRATWDAKQIKTVFDAIVLRNHANSSWWIKPFNDRGLDLVEHDETGVILYGSNKSLKKTTLDGYFIYKHDDRVLVNGDDADIYTIGARAAGRCGKNWKYRVELAPQWGHKNGTNIRAFGADSDLAYYLNDKYNNHFHAGYEFRSGSHNPNGAFDILWGRFPHWSNIFNDYLSSLESLPSQPSNYHRITVGWGFDPCKKVSVAADYHLLFANQNTFAGTPGFSGNGKFRGQLISGLLKYTLNEHVSGHFVAELFCPGDYYDSSRNDVAVFLRYQLMFTW